MPAGLKIQNRTNLVLFDASWTAGVDYDTELFEEQVEDADYDSDQSSTDTENLENEEMDNNELGDILEEQYIVQQAQEANENDEEYENNPGEVKEEGEEEPQEHEEVQDEPQAVDEGSDSNDDDYQEDIIEGEHQDNNNPGPRRLSR